MQTDVFKCEPKGRSVKVAVKMIDKSLKKYGLNHDAVPFSLMEKMLDRLCTMSFVDDVPLNQIITPFIDNGRVFAFRITLEDKEGFIHHKQEYDAFNLPIKEHLENRIKELCNVDYLDNRLMEKVVNYLYKSYSLNEKHYWRIIPIQRGKCTPIGFVLEQYASDWSECWTVQCVTI